MILVLGVVMIKEEDLKVKLQQCLFKMKQKK